MDANFLKKIYEKCPRSIKKIFAPLFVGKMINNPVFKKTWEEIDRFQSADEGLQKDCQLKKLKETLVYAYENVPFYKKRFDDVSFNPYLVSSFSDIKDIPLLEKVDAIKAGEEIYSLEPNLDFYETFTGGSSGQALRVLLDADSVYKERAYVCHFLSKHGFDIRTTRTVALFGHNKNADFYYSPLKNEIVISPFRLFKEEEFDGVYEDIKKFNAKFIAGYPSAIYSLAKMVNKLQKKLVFKKAVFYAENYTKEEKEYIEHTFECSACSYYGHTERAVFAEILDENCVFDNSYGYTELLPTEDPDEFRIVCTGFVSKKMPLIRYATDDVVRIDDNGGMTLIGHKRSDTHLIAKNGAPIFKGAMTLHLPELSGITRYQYYQNTPGSATLRLMTSQPLSEKDENALKNYIATRTEGLLDVDIEYVDQIDLTTRGKERWAIVETLQ